MRRQHGRDATAGSASAERDSPQPAWPGRGGLRLALLTGVSALALGVPLLAANRANASCISQVIDDSTSTQVKSNDCGITVTGSGSIIVGTGQAAILVNTDPATTILNAGSLFGAYAVRVETESVGLLSNSGELTATLYGVLLNSGVTMGTLVNSGKIFAQTDYGINNSGSIGTLSNSGSIGGATSGMVNFGTIGTLSNSGSIVGTNYVGIWDTGAGSIGVLNDTIGGVISGYNAGIAAEATQPIGTLSSSGTITGTGQGVYATGPIGTLSNAGGGLISGGATGIENLAGNTIGALSNSGGHSGGIQSIRVPTGRGWVMLAGDATHLWRNIRQRNPFPVVVDVARMLKGFEVLNGLSDGPDHVIPGHDPLVLKRFPPLNGNPEISRLDVPPIA